MIVEADLDGIDLDVVVVAEHIADRSRWIGNQRRLVPGLRSKVEVEILGLQAQVRRDEVLNPPPSTQPERLPVPVLEYSMRVVACLASPS